MSEKWETKLDFLDSNKAADAMLFKAIDAYRQCYDQRSLKERVKSCDEIVKLRPDAEYAWLLHGLALIMVGRHTEGIKSLKRAAKLKPHNAKVLGRCVLILALKRLDREADAFYRRATNAGWDEPAMHFFHANVLSGLGKFREGLVELDKCLESDPDNSFIWSARAECLLGMGELTESLASCDKSIELNPQNYVAWLVRGQLSMRTKKPDEAIQSFDRLVDINPSIPIGWVNRAQSLVEMKKPNEAIYNIDKAIEIARGGKQWLTILFHAIYFRGNIRLILTMFSKARQDFSEAVGLAKELNLEKIVVRTQAMYFWASGAECYLTERYEKAEADLMSASQSFRESGGGFYGRAVEFLAKNIEVDRGLRQLPRSEDIESLRDMAEQILVSARSCTKEFGEEIHKIPRRLVQPILAKQKVITLLVDVLNGKHLDNGAVIRINEVFEKYLGEEWKSLMDGICAILRRLASFGNFKAMKEKESEILRSSKDFVFLDGYTTAQILKNTPFPVDIEDLLKQHIKESWNVTMDLKECFQEVPKDETEKVKSAEAGFFYTIRTEKGCFVGSKKKYEGNYKRAPKRDGPLVWIDFIGSNFSVRINRKHKPLNISGQPLEMLCLFLRQIGKSISKMELVTKYEHPDQVYSQLNKITSHILEPFFHLQTGESRTLKLYCEKDRRKKLTFCLIDYYEGSNTK